MFDDDDNDDLDDNDEDAFDDDINNCDHTNACNG